MDTAAAVGLPGHEQQSTSSVCSATPTSLPCKDRQPIPSLTAPQLVGVLSKKDLSKGGALVKVRHCLFAGRRMSAACDVGLPPTAMPCQPALYHKVGGGREPPFPAHYLRAAAAA